jgi:hypothetical protein
MFSGVLSALERIVMAVRDVAELGREDNLVAPVGDRAPDELLVRVGAVDFGGVDEGDPEVKRAVNRAERLCVGSAGARVVRRHAHAAEADPGHVEPAN